MLNKVSEIVKPVYMVGGCVRDEIMGRTPNDYDFATPLTPDEIEANIRFAKKRPYLVGKRFGTVGMKLDGELVEITSFRTEKYINNSRKPQVEFVQDITADLSRRDFTINAMAKRADGSYIDPFGGRDDINNKIIRAVGNPTSRFKEDPLRMLRAARFVAQLGFGMDDWTFERASKMAYKILHVSKERWMIEMDKILMSEHVRSGLYYVMEMRLFNYMIPELAIQNHYDQGSPWHNHTLWYHTLGVVGATPPDINFRWAALLHDVAKPFVRIDKTNPDRGTYATHDFLGGDMVERLARHLKWSNERRETVKEIVLTHLQKDSILKPYDDLHKNRMEETNV
jgi:tRNA nucleotidyltransferase (CCA-adding enzyme)